MRQLFGDAVRDFPLLAASVDEEQIFLPVVEKPKVSLRIGRRAAGGRGNRLQKRHSGGPAFARPLDHDGTRPKGRVGSHEAVNAVERIGCDAAAVAQARRELPVVDRASSEGRLGETGLTAII
jgi:hypothetical protein